MNNTSPENVLVDAFVNLIETSIRHETNAQVARDTGLSPSTVARYRKKEVQYPRFQVLCVLLNYAGYQLSCGPVKKHKLRAVK